VLNILLASVVAAASPATSAPASAPAKTSAAKPAEKPTDVICWVEEATGSHYPQRYCSTRGQLEQRERVDKEALDTRGRRPTGSAFGPQ
jgi:hypothetical protein